MKYLTVVLLFLCCNAYAAQDDRPLGAVDDLLDATAQIVSLGQIKVSSSRVEGALTDASLTEVPYNVSVLDGDALTEAADGSLPETLSHQEGVNLSDELGQGANARLDLRGFGGEGKNALVLFDGLRAVEPFDNSMTWHLYPSEYFERVEIFRGGASTVYGEGAFSGAINLKTKQPTKKPVVSTEHGWGSFNSEKHFVEGSATVGGVGLYIGSRYANSRGYRQNGDTEQSSALAKVETALSDRVTIKNAFYYAQDSTGIPGPLSPAEAKQDRRQKDPDGQFGDGFFDRLTQNALTLDLKASERGLGLTNEFGYRLREQNSLQSFGGDFPGISFNRIGTESFSNVLQGAWNASFAGMDNAMTAGVEWNIDDIHNPFQFIDLTFGPFASDRSIDRHMMGYFVQDRLTLWERVTLEAGGRFDRVNWNIYDLVTPELEKKKRTSHFSPKLGAELKLTEDAALYASLSESFKAPDANTLIFETPNLFLPNPSIDPQVARHAEAGLRVSGPGAVSARGDLFHIETKKEILFNDLTNLNENFDTQRNGFELYAQTRPLKQLRVFGGYTYTRALFDNGAFDGNAIPLTPRHRWSVGADLEPLAGLKLQTQANAVRGQYALNDFNNLFPAEDYWTMDARVSYNKGGWQLYLRVENLCDERYSSFTSSNAVDTVNVNPAPGRSFEAGFRWEV